MFATCLHCHHALGANEEIESFPTGQRLAFDSEKGRLWVVCPSCGRWNLTPLEERWEAVESAEALFRDTKTRIATGEIGLAKRRSGLELIRIGRPLRSEFASWRYGRQLRSRFRRAWFSRGMQAADEHELFDSLAIGAVLWAPILIVTAPLVIAKRIQHYRTNERVIRGVAVDGVGLQLRAKHARLLRLSGDEQTRWRMMLPHERGFATITGEAVLPLLGRILPHVNELGASERELDSAIAKIEHFHDPARFLDFLTREKARGQSPITESVGYGQRLALEMMAHEETERRALEGELDALRSAWEEAERIAAIADNLLLPSWIRRRFGGGDDPLTPR